MKAFVVNRFKQPLELTEVSEPVVGDQDVLVKVQAAGLNQLDEKIREGGFRLILPYKTAFILGHDVAGTVLQVGPAVRNFKPGDQVFAGPVTAVSAPSRNAWRSTRQTSP